MLKAHIAANPGMGQSVISVNRYVRIGGGQS